MRDAICHAAFATLTFLAQITITCDRLRDARKAADVETLRSMLTQYQQDATKGTDEWGMTSLQGFLGDGGVLCRHGHESNRKPNSSRFWKHLN